MGHVIDYSFARPNPNAIKAAGYVGVIRYVCPVNSATRGKVIDLAEAQAIRKAGLDLTLNFEWYETRPTKGFAAGQADADIADVQADALGYPRSCAIYYSVDFGAAWEQVRDYFRGVASRSRRPVGVYGGLPVLHGAIDGGLAKYGWVTNAASWSGASRWSQVRLAALGDPDHCHLLQHLHNNTPYPIPGVADTSFDPNTVLDPEYGQWVINHVEDPFVALTDAQQTELFEHVQAIYGNLFGGAGHTLLTDITALLVNPKDQRSMAHLFAVALKDIGAVQAAVDAVSSTGGTVDVDALAEAVADKLAQRMAE